MVGSDRLNGRIKRSHNLLLEFIHCVDMLLVHVLEILQLSTLSLCGLVDLVKELIKPERETLLLLLQLLVLRLHISILVL